MPAPDANTCDRLLKLIEAPRSPTNLDSRPMSSHARDPRLIRRSVDPRAVFPHVLPAEVQAVTEAVSAMPYDIEGVFQSHRSDDCTFDTMIKEFGAPDRLAAIMRGADTDRLDLAPEGAGLLVASLGLSRMHADDPAQIKAGMTLYDAFYRWSRDATAERHIWANHGSAAR